MTSVYRISIHIPHETSIVARQSKLDQQSSDSRLWVVVVVVMVVVVVGSWPLVVSNSKFVTSN